MNYFIADLKIEVDGIQKRKRNNVDEAKARPNVAVDNLLERLVRERWSAPARRVGW